MDIKLIRSKIQKEEYELTLHAIKRRIERKISTEDKPFPSYLIAGTTKNKRP